MPALHFYDFQYSIKYIHNKTSRRTILLHYAYNVTVDLNRCNVVEVVKSSDHQRTVWLSTKNNSLSPRCANCLILTHLIINTLFTSDCKKDWKCARPSELFFAHPPWRKQNYFFFRPHTQRAPNLFTDLFMLLTKAH